MLHGVHPFWGVFHAALNVCCCCEEGDSDVCWLRLCCLALIPEPVDPVSGPVLSSLRMDGELLNVFGLEIDRTISTGKLHALLHFHIQPIDVVVFHGSQGKPGFEAGFPLRCFQRLSFPHLATRLCSWRYNRSTRGASIPVLSY